jgi:hypothetical protein
MGGIFKVVSVTNTKDGFYEVVFEHSDYSSLSGLNLKTQLDTFKVGDKYVLVQDTPATTIKSIEEYKQ